MDKSGFIVVIEFGTSKIIGLLARKNEQGVTTILASETIASDTSTKYGVIYNIDETAGKVRKLVSLLENKSGKKIGKAYVSINGRSLRAINHTEIASSPSGEKVTIATLDRMEQQARLNKPEFFTNYSVLAPEYYIDGKYDEEPLEKVASSIEGRYRLIVGRPNIKTNIDKAVVEKDNIEIAGYIVGPVAAGALVLEESDRQAGCALIDFGAGTTTLSIYKDGLLRHLCVIPFGGRTITKDIQALGFVSEAAESYKIRYGRLGKKKDKTGGVVNSDINLKELNKVIQLREDEIILNLIHQIKISGFGDKLEAGIITIGGASQLAGLTEYLAEKTQLTVKRGVVKRVYINNAADLLQNPAYTQSLGMLLFAKDNCEIIEKPEPIQTIAQEDTIVQEPKPIVVEEDKQKKKKKSKGSNGGLFGLFERIQNFGGTMFEDEE